MSENQEEAFVRSEADAWFDRNMGVILKPAPADHPVIAALTSSKLPQSGEFIDLGGGSGKVAAGISALYPDWNGTVLEPSKKAVEAGSQTFPSVRFRRGSLARKEDMPDKLFDMAIICGVFTWIDRRFLSQAIANVDALVKPGGYVIVSDFDTPFPRANHYHHKEGLFTYKQDYALPFLSLNIYTQLYRQSSPMSGQETNPKNDPYHAWWMTVVLQKDLFGRYCRETAK
jgi:SAM-dependent methyltransferase